MFAGFKALDGDESGTLNIKMIPSPAGVNSGEPNLFAGDDGEVYLSWVEPGESGKYSLRFSMFEEGSWARPGIIAEGDDWFVNWADVPSIIVFQDGHLMAHWLEKSDKDTYAYDVKISQSFDSGKNWSKAFTPHRDGTKTEHGFVSMIPFDYDKAMTVWLDGRQMETGGENPGMTLRTAFIDRDGNLSGERLLDAKTCECCPTSVARTSNSVIVVYRDRSDTEIRDINIIRYRNGEWSEPETVFDDGWEIRGCPVNGPSVSAAGKNVIVTWFTDANNKSLVKASFSTNEGIDFQTPLNIDDGNPIGRMASVMLDDGSALICWIEDTSEDAEIRVRHIWQNGKMDKSIRVAKSSRMRSAGFPRMIRNGNKIFFAWTQPGKPSIINTAIAEFSTK